jgi:hypothetical protein
MKHFTLLKTLTIAFFLLAGVGSAWGQTTVSYDFSADGAVSGLNEASPGIELDANIGFGSFKNSGTSNPGIFSGQLRLYQNPTKGGSIKIYASNGVTITQVIVNASGTTGPAAFSVDGVGSTPVSHSSGTYTMTGLSGTDNVEFWCTGTSSGTRIYVDDFEVTYTSGGGPTITVTPTTLTGFTYLEGNGPSDEQDFTISGANLTANISIAATTNYEISTGTGESFEATDPIILTQSGGTVAENTIYVRLKAGLDAGTYNDEDITATSTDADNKTVTCSGSVSDPNLNVEDFANYPETGTSYNTGTFLGQDGSTWNYVKCAGPSAGNIDAPSPLLGRNQTPSAEIYSGTINGGIGTLSFEYMQAFSTNVDLNVFVNDNLVGNVTSSNQQSVVLNSDDIEVNVAGDFVLKFAQNGSGGQVSIDNVTWTSYSTGNEPPSITNITQDPASGITSSTTVSVSADVTDSDGTVEGVELKWGTSTGNYPNSIDMSLSTKGTYVTDTDIPLQIDGTTVYYVIYAIDDDADDATSAEQSYTVTDPVAEPSNHPTNFAAVVNSASTITVAWTDASPAVAGYLIKGSTTSYAAIVDPLDGTPESDALLVQNIAAGAQTHQFTGLAASTQYFFKIFPYNGSGATINYKTDDTVPQDDATTEVAPVPIAPSPGVVFISEVSDATGFNNEYIEFYNNSGDIIDLSNSKLIMQTDGTVWNISNLTGDTEIPANGLFVITRGATKTAFETEWGALPTNCNYSEGTSGMFFGTSTTRRWVLKDGGNPGIDDGTLIDDTETTVAGETNRTFQYPTGTWTTEGFSGNSTPGYLDSDEDPAAYIWTDEGTESNWGDANNWNPNQVPGPNTNVTIPSSKANIVIQATETADCHNLTVDGTLTIQSNATNTGSLIINGTVSGSGTMTMQRHIPAWTNNDPGQSDGWHLLGTPVATFNIDGSPFDPGSLDDFYGWSETTWEWLNHKVGNPTQMEPGIGYLVAYENTATKDFTGTFNNADVTHTNLSVTPTKGNGWHLLGNPFQSALHWTNAGGTWNPTNMETGAKILQDRTYVDITADGANQYIPANQGFFIKATNATNSITIPAAERVHNSTAFYKSVPANVLELAASDGINNTVRTWIQIMDDATAGFDEQYDMHFLGGMYQAPHLYSKISETERLSTNRIAPIEESTTVQLAFKSFHDVQYTIKANLVASFESNIDLILEDTQEGVQINLRETPEYTFAATANELTERFKLHLLKATGIHEIGSADFNIYAHGGVIYLNGNKATNAQIELFNTTGQRVFARSIYMDGLTQINPQLTTGWYVVKVSAQEGVATQKVFIK